MQAISLYDSKRQEKLAFKPIVDGKVTMYVCGPTVQSAPHAGHLRSALVYDIMRRWFTAVGYEVTLVRNVTDIDDKILENAKLQSLDWQELARNMEVEFSTAYSRIGIEPASFEPHATVHIAAMQKLISILIERGHAYQATDGSANVYFASHTWPSYGELTNQKLDDMEAGEELAEGKRTAQDFALWKATKPGEPATASWQSPWGEGRPGWHIECSAMSTEALGNNFDIHGGGLDLRFPHHENELAQSRAAGFDYANYWVHNGLVNSNGTKMSKSLGNFVSAADLFEQDDLGLAIRYYLLTAQYRANLEYHDGILLEAKATIDRIKNFLRRAIEAGVAMETEPTVSLVGEKFIEAMNDDFNVPTGIAILHDSIREGNAAIDSGEHGSSEQAMNRVVAILNVLNINPLAPQWARTSNIDEALVQKLIDDRNAARTRKDFAAADAIRDELTAMGVTIEDAANKTNWSIH
ncbi:MAG: cysteine--tRNA ligase [Micrococcales bacterium]